MSPLLFLDVDGVLNDHGRVLNIYNGVDRFMVGSLNRIIYTTDCEIVLSSAWRYMIHGGAMTKRGFEYLLCTHGADVGGRIVGVTPRDEEVSSRGRQISRWLRETSYDGPYAVLDDHDGGISEEGHPFVQTDGKVGLTPADADRVIKLLLP